MRRLRDISLRENDRLAVEQASEILRKRFPVDAVVLFGSKARGDDAPESDIDLLVLTSRTLTYAESNDVVDAVFPLQMSLGVVISPLIVPMAEWENGLYRAMPIRREVEQDGVVA